MSSPDSLEPAPTPNRASGFFQPAHLAEALALRRRFGRDILPVAGATLVGRTINAGSFDGRRLLDLTRVAGFDAVRTRAGAHWIGAGATFRQLEGRPALGALAGASRLAGGPAIRNRATLGGNLAAAAPDGSGCVAVLAVPATVMLASAARGERPLGIDDFLGSEPGSTAMADDELLTQIQLPLTWQSAWAELGVRTGASHCVVCCAVGHSGNGKVRIALGGVARTVVRARGAERILERGGFGDATVRSALRELRAELDPISDWRGSAEYRREMAAVLVGRLVTSWRRS